METKLIYCVFIYIFGTAMIYSSHNIMELILLQKTGLTSSQFGVYDMMSLIKFFSSFGWVYLAYKTGKYILTGAITCIGFCLCFCLVNYAPECMKARQLNFWCIIYIFGMNIFESGIFPLMDFLVLEMLETPERIARDYGRLRMANPIGNALTYTLQLYGKNISDKIAEDNISFILTILFTILVSISYFLLSNEVKRNNLKIKGEKSKHLKTIENVYSISKLFTYPIILLMVLCITHGVARRGITSYLSDFMKRLKYSKDKILYMLMLRIAPEIIMLFCTRYFEYIFGTMTILGIAILFGISRPLIFGLSDEKTIKYFGVFFFIFQEINKSVFAAFFGYSTSKLFNEFSENCNHSLAQGINSACYNGMGPFISGVIAYFSLKNDIDVFDIKYLQQFFIIIGIISFMGSFSYLLLLLYSKRKVSNK
ncbi:hypothetical protein TCON_0565 [Astathelohania contejeani]|uniref:Major facilitator superfamily associated domain-containing protein n=1 Tax=Astathelohania contejeani TaxID=164912 RepID=A0ABQ7I1J4_9MICR|nr:hypothetical protein TCON_0565 [Thelohania contejeani]